MNWLSNIVQSLARNLGALSPGCKEASRLQSAALDRKLTLPERCGLRCHLLLCEWCRRYGKQIKFLCSAAREHNHDDQHSPPHRLPLASRDRIKQMLRSEQD